MTQKEQQRKLLEIHTRQFLKAGGKIDIVPSGHSDKRPLSFSERIWLGAREQAKQLL